MPVHPGVFHIVIGMALANLTTLCVLVQLQKWIASGSVSIIDVRPEVEFSIAHIPGAILRCLHSAPFAELLPSN